jgi:hypothetical protein
VPSENEKFGTFSLYRQLSDGRSMTCLRVQDTAVDADEPVARANGSWRKFCPSDFAAHGSAVGPKWRLVGILLEFLWNKVTSGAFCGLDVGDPTTIATGLCSYYSLH